MPQNKPQESPSKLIQKNITVISKLRELNLDFNDLFILESFYYQEDQEFFKMFEIPSIKDFNLSARFQLLKKMQYLVTDPENIDKIIISVKGKKLIEELSLPEITLTGIFTGRIQLAQSKTPEECFEEWWKLFPTTPAWTSDDKQKKFIGSRSLKNLTKAKAKKRYLELLNQGLKHEELIGSLHYEIKLKKLDSIKKNENQMEYFKGMESYLNMERYLLFIDSYRNNPDFIQDAEKVNSKKSNVTDI